MTEELLIARPIGPPRPKGWRPPRPRGVARVLYSPGGRFRSAILCQAEKKTFGRDERADMQIADPQLRGAHFDVLFDGISFHVWEVGGTGKLAINGQPGQIGKVPNAGFVVAGQTTIGLWVEGRTPPPPESVPAANAKEVIAALAPFRDAGTLYGVFDSARDPRVLVVLNESVEEHASLYEGGEGAALDDVAPYLVKFSPGSQLLERIVSEGWGKAWGVFARSTISPKDVRRHFRRFLMVRDEVTSERLFFRFYDPRVLRDFLPIATPRQQEELLFGMDAMMLESEDGALQTLTLKAGD